MDDQPTPDRTRRDGVRAVPIILADGQAWGLASPTTRLRPRVEAGVDALGRPIETIRVAAEFGHPVEIRRLVAELQSACDRGPAARQYESLIRLAIALIRRAHDVEPEFAASLLEIELEEIPRLVDAVVSVATGDGLDPPASVRKSEVDD